MCSGKVGTSCTTTGTRRVTLSTNPKVSHERGKKDGILTTTRLKSLGTYFMYSTTNKILCISIKTNIVWLYLYFKRHVSILELHGTINILYSPSKWTTAFELVSPLQTLKERHPLVSERKCVHRVCRMSQLLQLPTGCADVAEKNIPILTLFLLFGNQISPLLIYTIFHC